MPGLLSPIALGLAPLLGFVILLYMLRLRREDQRVPSTLLWAAAVHDPPANTPWQRLRSDPLLLLQLLFLAAAILALARPFVPTADPVGSHLILLVDRSVTMAAADGDATRLDLAKREALRLIDAAGDAPVTLIAFDRTMEVLAASEMDVHVLREAVSRLRVVPWPGDITDALTFAGALADGRADSRIAIVSDGRFALDGAAVVRAPVRHLVVGSSSDNQGIVSLSISEGSASASPELFVKVANGAQRAVTRRAEVWVDGALYDVRDLDLPPSAREAYVIALPPESAAVEARLSGRDALPLDDAAWAVAPPRPRIRVTLVSDGNRFLETAIELLPSLESMSRRSAAEGDAPYGIADVVVLDGAVPARMPPGNVMLIGPTASTDGMTVVGSLERPSPRVVDERHPLVAGAVFESVSILSASALELAPSWRALVVADVDGRSWPLVAEGRIGDADAVVLAFDVRQSDLPLRPAFPLFVAAAVDALAPAAVGGVPAAVRAGDPVALHVGPRAEAVRVVSPSGRTTEVPIEYGIATYAGTDAPGVYEVDIAAAGDVRRARFAANLAISDANVAPRERTVASARAADADARAGGGGRRELWWPIAAAALGVLTIEWLWFHERAAREAARAGRDRLGRRVRRR